MKKFQQSSNDSSSSLGNSSSSVQNNIEIYATLPKKKGKKLSGDKLSLAAPIASPQNSSSIAEKKSKDKKSAEKKDKSKEKKNKSNKQDDSDYSSDHSNKKSPSRKNTDSDDTTTSVEAKDEKSVGKKQHKIRRKLLMGGLIRRKNRSMPDLREGQEDDKQNFEEVEVRSLSRPTTPSEKSMAGYLSEGHLEYNANPNLERSKLMRKSFHGSVGKGVASSAASTKVPPPIPQRTSSQLSQKGEKKSATDRKCDRRPALPLPQNGEDEECPPALPPRSFTPELSSNTNNCNINSEPLSLPYNSQNISHQYDNINVNNSLHYSINPQSNGLHSNLPIKEKHVYSQPCIESNNSFRGQDSNGKITFKADVHMESSRLNQKEIFDNGAERVQQSENYGNNKIYSTQSNAYRGNSSHPNQYESNFQNNNSVKEENYQTNSNHQQQTNNNSNNNNQQQLQHSEIQVQQETHQSTIPESRNHQHSSQQSQNELYHQVESKPSISNNSIAHSRQGSEDFPPPPPPLEEALEDLKSRGLLPSPNSLPITNLNHSNSRLSNQMTNPNNPTNYHPSINTNHTNNRVPDHCSQNMKNSVSMSTIDSHNVHNGDQNENDNNSLLSQLQQKRQQIISNQICGNTNSMEREKSNNGKKSSTSNSGSNWLQELQAKQAALKQRQNGNEENQPRVDDNSLVKDLTNRFENTSVNDGVDEVDCAPRSMPQVNNTKVAVRESENNDKKIHSELFNREYTQCNSLTFPSQSGQESRLMNSIGGRARAEPSETGILKQISTPVLKRHSQLDSNGNQGLSNDGIKKKSKKSVTFCDQVVLVATAEDEEEDAYIPNPILERVLKSAMTTPNSDGSQSPAIQRHEFMTTSTTLSVKTPVASPQENGSPQNSDMQRSINASKQPQQLHKYPPPQQTQMSHSATRSNIRPTTSINQTTPTTTAPQYRLPPPYQPPPSINQTNLNRNIKSINSRVIPNGMPSSQMIPGNNIAQQQRSPLNGPYQHPPAPSNVSSPASPQRNIHTSVSQMHNTSLGSNSGSISQQSMARYQPPPHPNNNQQRQMQTQDQHAQQQQSYPARGPIMTRQNSNLGEQRYPSNQQPTSPQQLLPPYQKVPYTGQQSQNSQQPPQHQQMFQQQRQSNIPSQTNNTQNNTNSNNRYLTAQRGNSVVPLPQGYGSVGRGGVVVPQQTFQNHIGPYQHPPKPQNTTTAQMTPNNAPSTQTNNTPGHFAGPLDPNAIYSTVNKSTKKNAINNNTNINSTNNIAQNTNNTNLPKSAIQPCNLCHKKAVTPPSIYCYDCNFYMSRFKPKS